MNDLPDIPIDNLAVFRLHFERYFRFLEKKIKDKCNSATPQTYLRDIENIWKHYEKVTRDFLTDFLISDLGMSEQNIRPPSGKSDFPDIRVVFGQEQCAIEIKSAEKSPAFDMGRLDTYHEEHFAKYDWEYCVTIKWSRATKLVLAVYIEDYYQSIGRNKVGGVKYELIQTIG